MILQALNEYYERKQGSGELPPRGFQRKSIPFVIVLSPTGTFVQLEDTRTRDGNRDVGKSFLVPQERERSGSKSFEIANTLLDHYGYVLHHPKSESPKDIEMAKKQASSFLQRCKQILDTAPEDESLASVVAFLESDSERQRLFADAAWQSCAKIPGCNLAFRIAGHNELVCQIDAVRTFVEKDVSTETDADDDEDDGALPAIEGICLVTGNRGRLARKHLRTPILGVSPSSKSNAKLVSFQKHSGFDSYGRQQSYNAPVGEPAAFNYTTALNHLLRKGSNQRLQVGDASTVFWALDNSDFENSFAAMFGAGEKDNPDRNTQAVRNLLEATRTGVYLEPDADTRFCVLGLAPNAARIAVRFWQVGPVREFALNIRQHFDDIDIDKPAYASGYLSLFRLLNSIALLGKSENVPPDLAGDTMRAILAGLPYPTTLLQAAVRRCRAEQAARNSTTNKQLPNVPYPRAAVIKASLNRKIRANHFQARMLTMSLDRDNKDVPYLLGRLFAAFEKLQQAAHKSDSGSTLNRTIRESYYGSASSSPSTAFPILVKLHQHHLSKLQKSDGGGLAHYFRSLVGEIYEALPPVKFPAHLSLPDQGLFAVGYYQQLQYRKQNEEDTSESTEPQGEN